MSQVSGQTNVGRRAYAIAGLAVIGLAISSYLTVVHFSAAEVACFGSSGCEEVNQSPYAVAGGVPVALLGAGLYASLVGMLWAERQGILAAVSARPLLVGLALAGVLYSAYLTYIEVAVLQAICTWCVVSAILITAIFVLAAMHARGLQQELAEA